MTDPYLESATTGASAVGPDRLQSDERSIGDIMSSVTRDVSQLMRQEVELAKAEFKQSSTRAGKGAGLLVGAAIAGVLFLVFLSVFVWWLLGNVMPLEWSALIVAVVWAIVAAVLAMVGKKELERIRGLPQTTDTISKIPNALKGQEEANR
jgi:Putative Actinobacterial Holin-X, holin superfamily III